MCSVFPETREDLVVWTIEYAGQQELFEQAAHGIWGTVLQENAMHTEDRRLFAIASWLERLAKRVSPRHIQFTRLRLQVWSPKTGPFEHRHEVQVNGIVCTTISEYYFRELVRSFDAIEQGTAYSIVPEYIRQDQVEIHSE
jgi:hypothetical protein